MADITFSKPTYTNGTNALSAATFQPLANALDEIAHKANRTGVLEADTAVTVPAYGIGVQGGPQMTGDFDNYTTAGFFIEASGTLGAEATRPFTGESTVLEVVGYSSVFCIQRATSIGPTPTKRQKIRWKTGTTVWSAWYEIFNSFSDENVGQQPAPKPKAYDSGLTPGEVVTIGINNGAVWDIPGGTWFYHFTKFDSTLKYSSQITGVTTDDITSAAGEYWSGFAWRIL